MNQEEQHVNEYGEVHRSLEYDIPFVLRKTKRKTISIRISYESCVLVSAPMHMSLSRIIGFVDLKHLWIQEHTNERPKWNVLPVLSSSEKKIRSNHIRTKAAQFLEGYSGKKPLRIFIRYSQTRWGSCSSLGNISLNGYLDFLPDELFHYVICHELTHLQHMNHSRAFWDHLTEMVEKPRMMKKWLNQYKIPTSVK